MCLVEWGYVGRRALPARTDVLLFSLAAASICHCYRWVGGWVLQGIALAACTEWG